MKTLSPNGRLRPAFLCASAIGALALPASGISVINFDGTSGITGSFVGNQSFLTISGANTSFGGDPGTTDRRGYRLFNNATTPWVAASSTYTGPSFYGSYETIRFDVGSGHFLSEQQLVSTSETNAFIRSTFSATSGAGGAAATFLYFTTTGGGISFDATSQLSLTTATGGGGLTARWVVNDGGTYYISSDTFSTAASTTTNLFDPNATTWATWVPSTTASALLNFDQAGATFSSHTFTNILGAGIHAELDLLPASGTGIEILKFSVDAVPEPSGALCLLLSLGFLGTVRRRQG